MRVLRPVNSMRGRHSTALPLQATTQRAVSPTQQDHLLTVRMYTSNDNIQATGTQFGNANEASESSSAASEKQSTFERRDSTGLPDVSKPTEAPYGGVQNGDRTARRCPSSWREQTAWLERCSRLSVGIGSTLDILLVHFNNC